ncbi:MAG: hypothetical protein D3922_09545, partial [Candidatus Electrothrix sp. AR1]|nr:hypothetical protein [Candidatus Electrothrix sp. AR1]
MKIQNVSKRATKNASEIKSIKASLKPPQPREPLKVKTWCVGIYHAIINPVYQSKVLLTDSTWEYVDIYLKQKSDNSQKHKNAIFYWQQARNFFNATKELDSISKPLTTYYCFLNATKSLLEIKNIPYDFSHGVSGKTLAGHDNIKNEIVRLKTKGVLSGLSSYFEEAVQPRSRQEPYEEYTLKDILYNLAYVHRAYNITYSNQAELFVPIKKPKFVQFKKQNRAWFQFELEPEHSNKTVLSRLKELGYEIDINYDNSIFYTIRKKKRFKWIAPKNQPDQSNFNRLHNYMKARRKELRYIYSPNELWYIKRKDLTSASVIDRNTLVLTYSAMHRLSELSRYQPNVL